MDQKGKIQGLVKAENLFSCIEIVAVGSMPSNESSRLKLKYENNIDKQIFTYVQSKPYIEPTLKEKYGSHYLNLLCRNDSSERKSR